VLGEIAGSISNEMAVYLKHKETYKVIVYTNTKLSAEGHLLELGKKVLSSNAVVSGNVIPLSRVTLVL
jgi:hypothetical protein